jgi:hypothetical protein
MVYRLFRAIAMLDSGVICRVCGDGVSRRDQFGISESVCTACRS